MNIKTLSVVILSLTLVAQACRKKDQTLEQRTGLPIATQNGMNTFGAMVNDELLVPKKPVFSFAETLTAGFDYPTGRSPVFFIRVGDTLSPTRKYMTLVVDTVLTEGTAYPLQDRGNMIPATYRTSGNNDYADYTVAPPLTGRLTITKFDTKNHIVSGTFYFDAINAKGQKVSVTDGRFDVKY